MGYYTNFELTTDVADARIECPTCGHCKRKSNYDALVETIGYDPFEGDCKWYSWKEDMVKHSLKYPDVLFTIDGEGEESGDVWRAYVKNGKMQVEQAEIKLAAFDPSKLVEE